VNLKLCRKDTPTLRLGQPNCDFGPGGFPKKLVHPVPETFEVVCFDAAAVWELFVAKEHPEDIVVFSELFASKSDEILEQVVVSMADQFASSDFGSNNDFHSLKHLVLEMSC